MESDIINLKTIFSKWIKIMLCLISVLFVFILILVGILIYYSPGKAEPYLDTNGLAISGSISEKVFVNIGGIKQGMFIKGKDLKNPVLLYVHGGPCFPNYFLIDKFAPGLEDIFTVCYWEQRGGGLSYSPDIPIQTMTFEQLTNDAIDVTNYLRKRFKKEKIYMLAHSGGTPFAIQAVEKEPDLYFAYIGMGQITNQSESEKIAYNYLMEHYRSIGNKNAIEKLKKFPITESDTYIIPFHKSAMRDQSMHELGIGTMRNMKSVLFDIFIPVWTCKAYTLREKIDIWISKFSFVKKTKLIDQLFSTDITKKVTKLDVPVYFFSGKYDLTVNVELSKKYLKQLEAPLKGFYTFNNSAHSPIFEESEKFNGIMIKDVLNLTNILADNCVN